MARGIAAELAGPGAPFAYADTENRRAMHYRDSFPEMLGHYIDFGPEEDGKLIGYPPERGIEMLDFIEASDAKAMVWDSLSGFWEGINGVLDLQAEELARMGGSDQASLRAWAKVKPRYRKLINRIIQSAIPMVICTRAKPVIPDPKRPGKNLMPTKIRRDDVPWDVAADKDLIFEYSVFVILDPKHPGAPLFQIKMPDQFKAIFPPDVPLSEETGRAMARWTHDQTSAAASKALMDEAREVARKGGVAMAAWWKALARDRQAVLLPIRAELKETAARIDAAPVADQSTFFDEPAVEGDASTGMAAVPFAIADAEDFK
jgi:hypothetical protein